MVAESSGEVLVLVAVDEDDGESSKAGRWGSGEREVQIQSLPVERIRASLAATLGGLEDIFVDLSDPGARFPLKEIEVAFEITASGSVAILGTGTELAGKGALVLRFGK